MIAAITGSNGFIGRHLVRRFGSAGWEVRSVTRADYASDAFRGLLHGADVVVHAAAATRAPTKAALHASNVDLTARTLAAAQEAGVGRFVFVSSQAAAGPARSPETPVTEADVPAPVEAYGLSKLEAERLVRGSAGPWVIVRPAAVYGAYDRDFLALHRLASRGIAVHAANRDQWISIVHVNDVADAIVLAATSDAAPGGTFFLTSDVPAQWSTIFRLAAGCAGRKLRVDLEIPRPIVDAGARIGDMVARVSGTAGLLTTEKVALSRDPYWICSAAHARELLGFSARVNLQDGLCDTYHWYRTNGWLA